MKKCPEGKIYRLKTKRCVLENGILGKEIILQLETKDCKPDQIFNPFSNRCVLRNGRKGIELLGKMEEPRHTPKQNNKNENIIIFYRSTKAVLEVRVNTPELYIEQSYIGANTKRTFFETLQQLIKYFESVVATQQDQGLRYEKKTHDRLLNHLNELSNNMITCKKTAHKSTKTKHSSNLFSQLVADKFFPRIHYLVSLTAVICTSDYDAEFKPSQSAIAHLKQELDKLPNQDLFLDGISSKHHTLRQVLSRYGDTCINTIGYDMLEVCLYTYVKCGGKSQHALPSNIHHIKDINIFVTMYTTDDSTYCVNVYDNGQVYKCTNAKKYPSIKTLIEDPPASMPVNPKNIYTLINLMEKA